MTDKYSGLRELAMALSAYDPVECSGSSLSEIDFLLQPLVDNSMIKSCRK